MSAAKEFLDAKAAFLDKARNATATDGIIDGGQAMEAELIDLLRMGIELGLSRNGEEVRELQTISQLLAEDDQGKIEEGRWHEVIDGLGVRMERTSSPTPDAPTGTTRPGTKDPATKSSASQRRRSPSAHSQPSNGDISSQNKLSISQMPKATAPTQPARPIPPPPSQPIVKQEGSDGDGVALIADSPPPTTRPKTGGKSMEIVKLLLPAKHAGSAKRKGDDDFEDETEEADEDEEDEDEDDELEEARDSEAEVKVPRTRGRSRRPKPKRRRIVSSARVESDGESVDEDGWRTFESINTCERCIDDGRVCKSFVRKSKGRQRYACKRCHNLKQGCSNMVNRRRAMTAQTRARRESERKAKEENEEDDEERELRRKRPIRKKSESRRPPLSRKAKGKSKATAADDGEGDRAEDGVASDNGMEGSQSRRNKGKGKALGDGNTDGIRTRSRVQPALKAEDDDGQDWDPISPFEAGPSSQRRQRRRPGAQEIAELYNRMTRLEEYQGAAEGATALRFRELQQDVDRLSSNAETQKKFFGQELARVESQSQAALDRAEGVQHQVDSLRQQTQDMHSSLTAIHSHSNLMTESLKAMMTSFSNLRFDIPNALDSWMSVKIGQEGGQQETVSGAQLHQPSWSPSGDHFTVPPCPEMLPPLVGLPPVTEANANPGTSSNPVTPRRPPPPANPTSPADSFSRYLAPNPDIQNEALLDLEDRLDADDKGGSGHQNHMDSTTVWHALQGPDEEVQRGEVLSSESPFTAERSPEVSEEAEGEEGMEGTPPRSPSSHIREPTPAYSSPHTRGPTPPQFSPDNGNKAAAELPSSPIEDQDSSAPRSPIEEDGLPPARSPIQEAATPEIPRYPTPSSETRSAPTVEEDIREKATDIGADGEPREPNDEVARSSGPIAVADPEVLAETILSQSSTLSSAPTVICHQSVEPPDGLLARLHVSPPSSQAAFSSPSPNPDFRLLNAPTAVAGPSAPPAPIHAGPITRSRSHSRSNPPAESSQATTPTKKGKGSRSKKPASRR